MGDDSFFKKGYDAAKNAFRKSSNAFGITTSGQKEEDTINTIKKMILTGLHDNVTNEKIYEDLSNIMKKVRNFNEKYNNVLNNLIENKLIVKNDNDYELTENGKNEYTKIKEERDTNEERIFCNNNSTIKDWDMLLEYTKKGIIDIIKNSNSKSIEFKKKYYKTHNKNLFKKVIEQYSSGEKLYQEYYYHLNRYFSDLLNCALFQLEKKEKKIKMIETYSELDGTKIYIYESTEQNEEQQNEGGKRKLRKTKKSKKSKKVKGKKSKKVKMTKKRKAKKTMRKRKLRK